MRTDIWRTTTVLLSLAILAVSVGCGPEMPTAEEARAIYEANESSLESIDEIFRAAKGDWHLVEAQFECDPSEFSDERPDEMSELSDATADQFRADITRRKCTEQKTSWREEGERALREFKRNELPELFRNQPHVLGGEVRLVDRDEATLDHMVFEAGASPPGSKHGTVFAGGRENEHATGAPIEHGLGDLGWGLYQAGPYIDAPSKGPLGEAHYYRGIHVSWTIPVDETVERRLAAEFFVLDRHERDVLPAELR